MPDRSSIKTAPFQFTLRTLFSVTLITAVLSAVLAQWGQQSAPLVVAVIGVLIGYFAPIPGWGFHDSARSFWVCLCGLMGAWIGVVICANGNPFTIIAGLYVAWTLITLRWDRS